MTEPPRCVVILMTTRMGRREAAVLAVGKSQHWRWPVVFDRLEVVGVYDSEAGAQRAAQKAQWLTNPNVPEDVRERWKRAEPPDAKPKKA